MIVLAALAFAATPIAAWSLDTDDGGFVSGGELAQWRWGVVQTGPYAGYDSADAWGTNLVGTYLNDSTDTLTFPSIDLSGAERPALRYFQWYALGLGDAGWIEADSGSGWTVLDPVYGYPDGGASWTGSSSGWEEVVVPLDGLGATPALRWVFAADPSGVGTGWFIDGVALWDGDVAPPLLTELSTLADTTNVRGPYAVEVDAKDDSAVTDVTLHWTLSDGSIGRAAMAEVDDAHWLGAIPGQPPDTTVSWWVEATDGANSVTAPTGGTSFRVYLPPPQSLTGPEGRVVASTAQLRWQPPTLTDDLTGYRVYRDGEPVLDAGTEDPDGDGWIAVDAPVTGGSDSFTVRAVYEIDGTTYEGDPSDAVTVDAVVPALLSLSPTSGYAGDTLRLTFTGEYLFFTEDGLDVDLGDGVSVLDVDVQDVDVARVLVEIDPNADVGGRSLLLSTEACAYTADDLFEVLAETDRPKLLKITPDSVRQGDSGTLAIQWSGELGDEPTVDLGGGIIVTGVTRGSDGLEVDYTVDYTAAIGDHVVTVDDGVRLLGGVTLEVQDALAPIATCGLGLGPGWLGVLVAAAAVRRR